MVSIKKASEFINTWQTLGHSFPDISHSQMINYFSITIILQTK